MPHQQAFAEGLADSLELTYFIELVSEFWLDLEDLHVCSLVFMDELSDLLLQLVSLQVGECENSADNGLVAVLRAMLFLHAWIF